MHDNYDTSDNLFNVPVPLFVINILPVKIDKVYYLIETVFVEQKWHIFGLVKTTWSDEKVLYLKI